MKTINISIVLVAMLIAALLVSGCATTAVSTSPTSTSTPSVTAPPSGANVSPSPIPPIWTQTYSDEGDNDSVTSVISVSDGGFLLAGTQRHYSDTEQRDLVRPYLLKTDASGKEFWEKPTDDYQSSDQSSSVFETADKDFMVFETRMIVPGSETQIQYELMQIKVDQNGNKIWSQTIDTDINAYQISINPSGSGFIICGMTFSGMDIEVIEVDSGGVVTSHEILPLPMNGTEYQDFVIQQAANGNFLVAAQKSTGQWQSDITVTRLDRKGLPLWINSYHSPDFRLAPSQILETANGEITIIGSAGPPNSDMMRPYAELYVLHLDSAGNQLWTTTWGDKNHGFYASLAIETQDGGYVIAGERAPLAPMNGVAYLLRIDSQGKEIWHDIFGDDNDAPHNGGSYVWSEANSVLQISDGFIVAGGLGDFPPSSPGQKVFLMKTGLEGNLDPAPFNKIPATPTISPVNPVISIIPVNQTETVNGITLTLEQVVIDTSDFRFNVLYTPSGYNPSAGMPDSIPGAMAEYSLDNGPTRELIVPPFSLNDKGIEWSWISDGPIPQGAKEMTIRITSVGKQAGPWEFRVVLSN